MTAAGLPEKGAVEVVNASSVANSSDCDLSIHQPCSEVVPLAGYVHGKGREGQEDKGGPTLSPL